MRYYKFIQDSIQNSLNILGMNRRNLEYIYPSNPRKYFEYANNKLLTKQTLDKAEISVPQTYLSVSYFYELSSLEEKLLKLESFVIKPSSGSAGNGIVVISEYNAGYWTSIGGKVYSFEMIKKHIADIIFGVYSFGLSDSAIIEHRIIQNKNITRLSPDGLADIRMINYKGENIKAMLRVATKASDGKANLHQGGIGIAIDLLSGKTTSAQIKRTNISKHPDTHEELIGFEVPYWNEVLELCKQTAKVIPLGYLGIDIAISEHQVFVLEVNARPGIEIQNISGDGLIDSLQSKEIR